MIMAQPTFAFCFATRVLTTLVMALALLMGQAHAATEQRTVESGKSSFVPSNNPLVDQSGPLKGKVTIATTDPKGLTYTAPEVDNTFSETVTFKDGETPRTLEITVVPAQVYSSAFKTLFLLFVIAILLESALAIIFNWRVFLVLFDGRGMRTVVSIALALAVVWSFDLDALTDLIKVYSGSEIHKGHSWLGKFITALILAGGSSGVNNIFIALGYRSRKTEEEIAPRPKGTDAWVAVRLMRTGAVGPVLVHIGPAGANPMPVAGVITGSSKGPRWCDFFFRDEGRFPGSGGHTVAPGLYEVWVTGHDTNGNPLLAKWGPNAIAEQAIVDIEFKL